MIPTYKCLYFPHLIFQLLTRKSVTTVTELKTFGVLQIGAVSRDYRYFNGRVACVRVFNLALTEDEVEREMEDWKCPEKPGKSSRFQIIRSKKTKGGLFYTQSRLYIETFWVKFHIIPEMTSHRLLVVKFEVKTSLYF